MTKPGILAPRILCGYGVEECEEDGGEQPTTAGGGQGRRRTDDEEFLNRFTGSR